MHIMSPQSKYYVGVLPTLARQVFRSATIPTKQTHGQYISVIGPFRLKRNAILKAAFRDITIA